MISTDLCEVQWPPRRQMEGSLPLLHPTPQTWGSLSWTPTGWGWCSQTPVTHMWSLIVMLQVREMSPSCMAFDSPRGLFHLTFRKLSKIFSRNLCNCRNRTSYENFKLKLCTCAQGTRTKFQLEILTINVISGIVYFCEMILERSWNVSQTTLRPLLSKKCEAPMS